MDYVIEKNSPLPPHPTKGSGKWQNLLSEMSVGDAVTVKSEEEVRGIRTAGYGLGMKIKSRRIDDGVYWVKRVQ